MNDSPGLTATAEAVFVRVNTASPTTVTVTSLDGTPPTPAVVVLANALLTNVVLPASPSAASADTCKVTRRPGSRSPTDHSTVLPVTAPEVLAGSITRPVGKVSLTTTSSATESPWFSTSILKVTVPGTSPEPVGGEKI